MEVRAPPAKLRLVERQNWTYPGKVSSVLETPETREQVVPISREFYHEAAAAGLFDREVELIEGIILRKMAKSPLHVLLVRRLYSLLTGALEGDGLSSEYFVAKEDPIVTADSEPEPDLAVIPGTPDQYHDALPTTARLIVEVSVNTLERDRLKARIYAAAGVPEYWIVDVTARQVERFRDPDPGATEYRQIETVVSGELRAGFPPSFHVGFADLFASAG